MRFSLLLICTLFAANACLPHSVEYLTRMRRMEAHDGLPGGIGTKDCLLVSPDGHFRLERSGAMYGSPGKSKVYLGQLTPDQRSQLQSLLNATEMKQLVTPPLPEPSIVRDIDLFAIQIPRERQVQVLQVLRDDQHSKIPHSLQELEKWFEYLVKQKLSQDKSALPNNCTDL